MKNENPIVNEKLAEFSEITDTETGNEVDVSRCVSVGVSASATSAASSAKTFDSPVLASKIIQDLTYTSKVAGLAGNDISIEYIDDVLAGSESVAVVGTAITVHIDAGATDADAIKAVIEGDPSADALVTIVVSGTGSNAQTDQVATNLTGGVDSEVDTSADSISIPSHGFQEGLKIRLTTTGALPAGLNTGVDYFVIVVDSDNIKLASDLANAQAGTAIDITDEGTGVHTVTPVALNATLKLQGSLGDGVWYDISGTSQAIAGALDKLYELSDVKYTIIRPHVTIVAGALNLNAVIVGKGYL